jgi:acetyl esterase/lipase
MRGTVLASLALVGMAVFPFQAGAADAPPQVSRTPPSASEVVRLWPGKAPGQWETASAESQRDFPAAPGSPPISVTVNVADPTMTVYRPAPAKRNGAAVVVIPGGGFMVLAMQHEGHDVARWLADRGVTAFVLKYRVRDLQIPYADYVKDPAPYDHPFDKYLEAVEPSLGAAVMDAHQAVRLIRQGAARYGIDPKRVGMMGFSAGAITTVRAVTTATPDVRPDFAAPIYGAALKAPVATGAPPLFLVHAQDDPAVPVHKSLALYEAWTLAKAPVELHVFEGGGHGFGLGAPGTPAAAWPELFEAWLRTHKIVPDARSN